MDATSSHKLNVAILNKKLAYEAWYNTFWSKISGNVSVTETNGIKQRLTAPNSAIQILTEFVEEGRDNMILPMLLDLTEPGVYGDAPLIGTGEEMALKYLRVYINQYSKAVIQKSGNMANQRLKLYNMMEEAQPALVKYFAKWNNQQVFATFYEGANLPLTDGTNNSGYGLKSRFHPNQYGYTASGTLTTWGKEKYTKTAAEVGTGADAVDTAIDYKLFMELRSLIDTTLFIEPLLTENGDPFWVFITNPYTYNLILQDTTIHAAQNAVFNSKMGEHPLFTGREFMYFNGFAIVKDPIGIRTLKNGSSEADTDAEIFLQLAANNSNYAKGWLSPCATGTGYTSGNLIVGRNAIGKGIAENLHFTKEIIDHERVIEIGGAQIDGYNRADFIASASESSVFSTANTTKASVSTAYEAKNQSSAIIWTAG